MNKVIDIINNNDDINIDVNNEDVIINLYINDLKNININIKQDSNSKIVLNFVSIVKSDSLININDEILGDNNSCILNVRTISEEGLSNFNVVAKAGSNTHNNVIIESLKGINEGGSVTLLPILEIDTNDVDAAHFATVGGFDKNQIFYLESKGLSYDTVYNMLKKSFLYSLYSDDFINKIKESTNE